MPFLSKNNNSCWMYTLISLCVFYFCSCVEHLQEIILIKTWTSALVIALWFGWLEHLESVMDFLLFFFLPWWVQVKFDNIRAPFNEMRRGCSPFYFQVHHILKDQHHLSSYMCIVFTLNWKTVIVLQKVLIYSQVTRLLFIYKAHHIFFSRGLLCSWIWILKKEA